MAPTPASPLLTLTDLAKCYRLYGRPADRLKELLLGRRLHEEFWALRGVTLTVQRGTSLGIIGENGAGKSTLLKLIAGVLTPTSGTVQVNGRVASIIELGMGFHPEFSGRENLFIGGALLRFSRKQMEAKLPAIEAFSELGPFLDRPLKSYSTGMAMRLAFSLAVSVEPDLLIVDEALAVGDGYFQKKCIDRIRAFQERGGSLLFCSHSLYAVNLLCQEVLWLRAGQAAGYGVPAQVIAAYEAYLNAKEAKLPELRGPERHPGGEFTEVRLEGGGTNGAGLVVTRGAEVRVRVRWKSDHPERLFHLGVAVDRVDNLTCFATTTLKDRLPVFSGRTEYETTVRFPQLPLTNSSFRIVAFLLDEHGVYAYDQRAAEQTLTVATEEKEWGICYLDHVWEAGE
ncbi:MAG TPA: ABC transporter ATP-binding protein [Candidatus Binatia bacterium]|jgi:lipopolysaccharide transport system ATP-binding protein|nr:ABC transporter ATP-binding protein [Candidatus Binatia bacterium]